jgi:hypothetical protein
MRLTHGLKVGQNDLFWPAGRRPPEFVKCPRDCRMLHRTPHDAGQAVEFHPMRHNAFIPITVALIIAIVGQAIVLFGDFGPGSHPHGSSNMITAAAVTRAGAIEIPVGPGNHSSGNGTIKPEPVARVGAIEIPVGPGNHPSGSGMVTAASVSRGQRDRDTGWTVNSDKPGRRIKTAPAQGAVPESS